MKLVDVVFGKRIGNSFYHVNTSYLKRYELNDEEDIFSKVVQPSINDLFSSNESLPEEVGILLHKINDASIDSVIDIPVINSAIIALSYLKYEFLVIFRSDLSENISLSDKDRCYAMVDSKDSQGLLFIKEGISHIFESSYDANVNSMLMEFITTDRLRLGDDDLHSLLGLDQLQKEYELLEESKESAFLDTTELMHAFELRGDKFIIVLSPMYIE